MFEYVLKFRNTTAHANADTLSRLPLPETILEAGIPPELFFLWIISIPLLLQLIISMKRQSVTPSCLTSCN